MSLDVLLLVLGAATAHACWNLAAKRAGAGGPVFVWLYACIGSLLLLPLAVGAAIATDPVWGRQTVIAMAGSVVLHLGPSLCLQRGYAVGDLSVVHPVARGVGPAPVGRPGDRLPAGAARCRDAGRRRRRGGGGTGREVWRAHRVEVLAVAVLSPLAYVS